MKNSLYNFTDDKGTFVSSAAGRIKTLYFPLCNQRLMSSVSPDLHGDIKTGQNAFLLEPVSRIDLVLSRASRNFWVYLGPDKAWSASGVSKDLKRLLKDEFRLEAGLLWHKVIRTNKEIGLKSEILSFIPPDTQAPELMQVKLTNISPREISFIPYAAIPLYGRSAANLRDHRHVTSLLGRLKVDKYGVKLKPTLLFDEAGHRPNRTVYFAAGCDKNGRPPAYIYPTQEIFCGEGGDLEYPEAVFLNRLPQKRSIQGREAMGALRFSRARLSPGSSADYIIVMGISPDDCDLKAVLKDFSSRRKVREALEKTKAYWQELACRNKFCGGSRKFDNWLHWVSIQPTLRKIYGCSFLPDFDYGKGGRGWRDLWQDCLGLILNGQPGVRKLLLDNFCGVKIDGSNATIIGSAPREFIADRNNISRVWSDHGIWPLLTLSLYIEETGDYGILSEQAAYFRNHQINRARDIDYKWEASCGNKLRTGNARVYSGSLLEHLLVQNLTQFFNVGSHNHLRLEGADWNDGLDMAKENGESAAFSAMYAHNLELLADLILRWGEKNIEVLRELEILLAGCNYSSVSRKRKVLETYFLKTCSHVSGVKVRVGALSLSRNLKKKAAWMKRHIQNKEWLKEGFFNGYYDNRKRRLEGKKAGVMRMTLASQVFPIMSGIARDGRLKSILRNVYRYLYDKHTGGIRLNTDFKEEQHDLGRAFSFAYGDKENGAVFSHMAVMFSYALYKQGYAEEGWKVLRSLYNMALSPQGKIYPCLPEYFDLEGRGMYSYLTGSASWFLLTFFTQACGVRGCRGDLMIAPQLTAEQFKEASHLSLERVFASRRLRVVFYNPRRLNPGKYRIKQLKLNSKELPAENLPYAILARRTILSLPKHNLHTIEVFLG